jgi:hypothetical protein
MRVYDALIESESFDALIASESYDALIESESYDAPIASEFTMLLLRQRACVYLSV